MDAPRTDFDGRYSDEQATAIDWSDGRRRLEEAELYWITTVRPDGRPHVTPLIGLWLDDAWWCCTGADERKARNLASNPQVAVTTGCNDLHGGLDVVVEGTAERAVEGDVLTEVAAAYEAKYGEEWHFDVGDGVFVHEAGEALVFRIVPAAVFGFGKDPYAQTCWRFG